jgi:hypothetical protein
MGELSHQSYPGGLVQIEKRRGHVARVKPEHAPPVVELNLRPGQYVVSIELTEDWSYGDRKTTDWSWTAYVATQLGGDDG